MNLTTYELDRIKDHHSKGRGLSRQDITKLIRELEIAKEDVRGIELKIDKTYEEKGKLRLAMKELLNIISIQPLNPVMSELLEITLRALEETK